MLLIVEITSAGPRSIKNNTVIDYAPWSNLPRPRLISNSTNFKLMSVPVGKRSKFTLIVMNTLCVFSLHPDF